MYINSDNKVEGFRNNLKKNKEKFSSGPIVAPAAIFGTIGGLLLLLFLIWLFVKRIIPWWNNRQ